MFKNTLLKVRMRNVSSFIWWLYSPPSFCGRNKVLIYLLYKNVLPPSWEYFRHYTTCFNTGCSWITNKYFGACFRPIYKGKTTLLLTTHGGPLDSKLSGPQSQFGHAGEEKDPYPCWQLELSHPLHNLSLH